MSIREQTPFDENTLRALFDEIEPPPGLADRWRAGSGRPRVRRLSAGVRMRAAAVVAGVVTVGAMVFAVAAADRHPPTGPDITITDPPATSSAPPTTGQSPSGSVVPPREGPGVGPPPAGAGPPPAKRTPPKPVKPPVAPARGPLPPGEWPSAGNVGVPVGTNPSSHPGDLHVTEPGAIISDLRIDGSVFVEAPDVTLRRVQVAPPRGAVAGVRQRATAPRLRIEDSDISGSGGAYAVLQEVAGLTISRSDLHGASTAAVAVTSDATIVDSYLHTSTPGTGFHSVSSNGGGRLILRHSTLYDVALFDDAGPVVDVTIENNQLTLVGAPPGSGSHDIRVRDNRFTTQNKDHKQAGSTGWNAQAPGNIWSGNVWADTGEPVSP